MHIRQNLINRKAVMVSTDMPTVCLYCSSGLPPAQSEDFMMINAEGEAIVCKNSGHFCELCDAVYLPEAQFKEVARLFEYNPFAVVGFLDLSQLPEKERYELFAQEAEEEIPLAEFSEVVPLKEAEPID